MRKAALAACLLLLLTPRPADADQTPADKLFNEGRTALAAGDLETACARFRASDAIEPAAGTRANLADCEERRGRLASAYLAFRSALEKLPPGDRRAPPLRRRMTALEPRLPRLTMTVSADAPRETTVREGETTLGTADTWGIAQALDPGVHQLIIVAPGRAPKSLEVTLVEGRTENVVVEPGAALPPPAAEPESTVKPDAPARNTSEPAGPWIVGGVGVASLIAGVVTGGVVLQKKGITNTECSDLSRTCTHAGRSAADAGRVLGPVTTVAMVVGAAGVVAGGIWLGIARSNRTGTTLGIASTAAGVLLRVEGSW